MDADCYLLLLCIKQLPPCRFRQGNFEVSASEKDGGAREHVGAKLKAEDGAVEVVGVIPSLLRQLRVLLVEVPLQQDANVVEDELVRMLGVDDAVHAAPRSGAERGRQSKRWTHGVATQGMQRGARERWRCAPRGRIKRGEGGGCRAGALTIPALAGWPARR
jgi:hypothetical protein